MKWTRPLWMNGKARKSCKKKYWALKRYAYTGSKEDYEKYTRKRNVSQNMKLQLRRDFEKLIVKEAKMRSKAFKSRNRKSQPRNYGPVSLTSTVGKLLEKVVRRHMTNHLQHNSRLTDTQHGFRAKRSTTIQLLKVLIHWTELLDEGSNLAILYLDFQKAFDTVPIQKRQAYGISLRFYS